MNRLVLPLPPTINHAYRNFTTARGRRMRVPTHEAMNFKRTAGWLAKVWRNEVRWDVPDPGYKVVLNVWFYWPNERRRDQDNPLKLLQDALTGVLWEDDRWVLPRVMDFKVDRQNPRVEVELEVVG